MRIVERGEPTRPPLVFVHGLASSSRCWSRNLAAFEAERRVLLIDLFSAARHPFSLHAAAQELARELQARHATPAEVVAHSMGGLVALHLAVESPAVVSRLALVDVPALPVHRSWLNRLGAMTAASFRWRATGVGLVLGSMLRTSPLLLLAASRATIAADLATQAERSSVPTLLIWGEGDGIVPLEVAHGLLARMPRAELAVIPGAGHQPMWEAPDAFNAVLAEFLSVRSAG